MSFKGAKWDSDGLGNTYDELFKNKNTTKTIKSKTKKSKHLKISDSPPNKKNKKTAKENLKSNMKLFGKSEKDEILTKSKKRRLKKLIKKQELLNENTKGSKNSSNEMKVSDRNERKKDEHTIKPNKERKMLIKKHDTKIKKVSEPMKTNHSKEKKKSRSLKKKLKTSIQQGNFIDQVEINEEKFFTKKRNENSTKQTTKLLKNDSQSNKTNSQTNKKKKFFEKLQSALTKVSNKKPLLTLRQKMLDQLKAARFRFLNEQIYTTDSKAAQNIFQSDPEAFQTYHEGYRKQVERWPLNPVDVIIKSVQKMPKSHIVADFGCGDAKLSKSVSQKVFSFDLVAVNETVIACDMSKVPLDDSTVDVVVFCLSLMGTNLHDYFLEANRVLKTGGVLKIAEVESRFENVADFIKGVQHFGFKNIWKDLSHNLFYFMDFRKENNHIRNKKKVPTLSLLPCLYKKR